MCRLLIYKGKTITLADILTRPTHSIINQAFDSRLRIDTRRPINGDGFGVGWYSNEEDVGETGPGPCIFTSITPAWNNQNLVRLSEKTRSRLIFGHVRASTAGVLAEVNCHPFEFNSLMWMHNGGIAEFSRVKRKMHALLREEYFLWMQGSTDSECAFALFLNCLHDLGYPPADHITFDATILRQAMLDTITKINTLIDDAGVTDPSLLNFAVTDGTDVVCTRYVSSRTDEAASLFFSSGTSFHQYEAGGHYKMERRDKGQDIVLVSSEPLTFQRADWVTVPTNSILTISKETVLLHPILDKYFVEKASYVRNDQFAREKGLLGTSDINDVRPESKREETIRKGSSSGEAPSFRNTVPLDQLREEAIFCH
ncbi:putative Glutamine amidotransferase [Taphrina deformans PYCC 5710]|uniref:Glutamine amidotransferase n=1 Tax=Taphrina deformans (strain PYCC 5710 / ATCC 11124 / CBS 356.35 / IMI 108563 / JCM 9778 / NBRC 8474) TaxID=1097556 RepID=R4XA10_TAPDE|nr:putative Glutamine amidotransferase [Taphrina deformans PYCC 5710]|eukprot:CCG81099.1 putative Glutamine amidotransferase [Taphrina deformans PYCC 5710]